MRLYQASPVRAGEWALAATLASWKGVIQRLQTRQRSELRPDTTLLNKVQRGIAGQGGMIRISFTRDEAEELLRLAEEL